MNIRRFSSLLVDATMLFL